MQYDQHSDELSLQLVSDPVVDALKEAKHHFPEIRRTWFADNHERIGKPLFVKVSKEGIVFATDDFCKTVLFCRQYEIS